MRFVPRVCLALFVLLTIGSVWVYTATENAVPKYTAGGTLVDSAISEQGGKVGIGTTDPQSPLEVVGIVRSTGTGSGFRLHRRDNDEPAWVTYSPDGSLRFYNLSGGGDRMALLPDGKVGIGTTSPITLLDVESSSGEATALMRTALNNSWTGLLLRDYNNANAASIQYGNPSATVFANELVLASRQPGIPIAFYQGGTAVENRRLVLDTSGNVIVTSGNVGIGTTSPSAKLHVAGNVTVDGNIGAKFQDVAEWVDSSEKLAAGTVVSADVAANNQVRASSREYDTSVAGVISAQPGILLGQKGAGKVAVAQSGRVRVRVDASFGAVQRGDLLVTSPRAGYAMRSEPLHVGEASFHRPGTILGKALEPLPSGAAEILVLLTLQ